MVQPGVEHGDGEQEHVLGDKQLGRVLEGCQHAVLGLLLSPGCGPQQEHKDDPASRDSRKDPAQGHAGVLLDQLFIFEQEIGEEISNESGRHVHGPEYSRISRDCLLVRIICQECTLGCPDYGSTKTKKYGCRVDAVLVQVQQLGDVEQVGQGGQDQGDARTKLENY